MECKGGPEWWVDHTSQGGHGKTSSEEGPFGLGPESKESGNSEQGKVFWQRPPGRSSAIQEEHV